MSENIEYDDRVEVARRCIEKNPYNTDAWNLLIIDSLSMSMDNCREFYDKLVNQFPTSGIYWKAYADKLIMTRDYEAAEKLFQHCLSNVLHVDLWKTYLNYIKETKYNTATFRENMAKAYDFAISKVGLDYFSFSIWNDYITFLTSVPTQKLSSEALRIQMIRKIYHKGISTPMQNIELLWNDYCHFEQVHSQSISKRQIDDKRQEYNAASAMTARMLPFIRRLDIISPVCIKNMTFQDKENIEAWKDYISFEKSNVMEIEDMELFTERIIFVFEQALLSLGGNLEILIDETVFLEQIRANIVRQGDVNLLNKLTDEISRIYERGTENHFKDCLLLHFSHVKFEESCLRYSKAHSIYLNLLAMKNIGSVDLIYIQYFRFLRRVEGMKAARNVFIEACNDSRATYRIYVAFAYMEYYCNKDQKVAHNIFNTALERYGEQYKCLISAYLDFVSLLNDDGIIRTAFGRYLGNHVELVEKYANFESHVGDLAAIDKVENRRLSFYNNDNIVTHIAERYSFMDLSPLPEYDEIIQPQQIDMENEPLNIIQKNGRFPLVHPDISQMLSYKPRMSVITTSFHPVLGGSYPPIASLDYLNSCLPPSQFFQGPFVNVDKFLEIIVSLSPIDTKNDFLASFEELKKADPGSVMSLLSGPKSTTGDEFMDIYSMRHSK